MNPSVVGIVTFVCTFGGVLLGMRLRGVLPAHHLDADSKDSIKVGIGLIATMTALVLGLVTASAKSSFDDVNTAIKQGTMEILAFDRALARYGPETAPIREGLKRAIGARIDAVWPTGSTRPVNLDPIASGSGLQTERLVDALRGLTPRDEVQKAMQARALDLAETLLQDRWIVLSGGESTVPAPFLVVLLFWLAITFTSFGLFAPRNGTVIAVLLVCAVSIAGAMFLVLEMDGPFDGLLRASPDPLRYAYERLGQ
jgi:hypothetical protein